MNMNFFATAAFLMLFLTAGLAHSHYCTPPVVQVTANAIDGANQIAATAQANWGPTKSYFDGETHFIAYWSLDGVKVQDVCGGHFGCYGMGITSAYQSPVLNSGQHTVAFAVHQRDECSSVGSDSETAYLQGQVVPPAPVNALPVAQFNAVCNGLTCAFNDMSHDNDGTIINWAWDFGDGYTSVAQNPQHSYTSTGTYLVTLQVTDDDNAASTTTGNVAVTGPTTPPANNEPVAYFTYTNATPNTFSFTDASTDSDGTITSYLWNFADGITSTSKNPTHAYAANGTYSVVLTVTDDGGSTDAHARTVTVMIAGNPNPNPTTNHPPASVFTYYTSGATATFTDSSYDSDGTIASYYWMFGDGTTSAERNPVHSYAAIASYTVSLRVTDDDGATHTSTQTIAITSLNRAPTANAGADASANTSQEISFIGTGTDTDGTIVLYEWDFDYNASAGFAADWSSSSTGVTTHKYTRAKTYYAYLRVTDDEGTTSTDSRTVRITGENASDVDTTGRKTYDFHLYGIDALRTYAYDAEEDTTTIKLKVTNMEDTERNFLIRDVVPKSFAEDIDDFSASPSYDKLYNRDPDMGWNVTLKPYETFTITYVFDGYESLNDTKEDFEAPKVTEITQLQPAEETPETPATTQDAFSALTGNVLGAFSDPQYGLVYLIVIIVLVLAFWKREYVLEKWKSFTERTEHDE